MLQGANTDLFNPLVHKAHNRECPNLPFTLQIRPVKVSAHLRIFIFFTLVTNGLIEIIILEAENGPVGWNGLNSQKIDNQHIEPLHPSFTGPRHTDGRGRRQGASGCLEAQGQHKEDDGEGEAGVQEAPLHGQAALGRREPGQGGGLHKV